RNTAHIVAEVTALGNLDDTLRSVVEGTVGVVGCDVVTLYVYDPDEKKLGYPPTMIGVRHEDRALQLPQVPVGSIVRKMLEEEQPYIVEEASIDQHFKDLRFTREEGIEACVAIPLKAGTERVGVMFVNYRRRHRFTDDELTNMKLFAYQAAVAIRNAQLYDQLTARYEEMKKIKAYIGAHTAVDWLKMVSTAWGHNIRREVGIVLGRVALLQNLLNADPHSSEVQEELCLLKEAVKHIKEIPIIAPLSYEDAINSIQVNDIIKKYLDRQWKHNRYKSVELIYDLQPDLDDLATVWASQEWLRHGLEIVVDNAVWAMQRANSPAPKITVMTRLFGDRIEISVMDTGPGIPKKIISKLFKEPIPKPEGSRGTGIGLMLAQTIFQTYRGDIRVGTTDRTGTRMLINLPIESQLGS
ncbi:MAG: GAF domain-containing sensor histidine kinase, partial [Anaerolineae bacterium]|nr:GAF domain-containing sensor histidine kinase [Anaerolineae bacterium]